MPPTKDNLQSTIAEVSALLENDPSVSPALRALIKVLIGFIEALAGKLNLDSHNGSKPPASDPNRKRKAKIKTPNERLVDILVIRGKR